MAISWTDPTLNSTIKDRKTHIDEIVTYLNVERAERGLSSVSITLSAAKSLVMNTHIMTLRTACDTTPDTVGCSSDDGTYYSTNNAAVYNGKNSSIDISDKGTNNGTYYSSVNYSHRTVYAYSKGPCFIGEMDLWPGLMQLLTPPLKLKTSI